MHIITFDDNKRLRRSIFAYNCNWNCMEKDVNLCMYLNLQVKTVGKSDKVPFSKQFSRCFCMLLWHNWIKGKGSCSSDSKYTTVIHNFLLAHFHQLLLVSNKFSIMFCVRSALLCNLYFQSATSNIWSHHPMIPTSVN